MIPRIKGLRISNAREREQITGSEFIPFQDEDVNGKIKLSNLKDVSIYVFNPEITDDWLNNNIITQEEYDALYNAVNNQKVIIVSPRVPVIGNWNIAYGQIILNSRPCLHIPKFVIQEGTENLVRIEYCEVRFNSERRLLITKHSTPDFLQTGNGKSVLTDNGQYVNIGNLALTNVVFEDGTNSCIYDLNSDKIVFGPKDTQCVTFNASKQGNTLNMKLQLAKATATMDGIMSKEDKVKLDTTLTEQITALQNAIAKEIQDRTNADNVLTVKIDKEVADRQEADELIHSRIQAETNTLHSRCNQLNSRIDSEHDFITNVQTQLHNETVENARDIRNIIDSKGQPNGIAVLDASGKVPSEQLPSYVDDVIDVYAKYDVSATGDITNIKLYSDQTLTTPIAGMSDKIYVDKTPNKPSYTFRWSGTQFTHITSGGLILGTITGTAFDGGNGQTIIDGFLNNIETVVEKIAMKLNGSSGVELDVTWGTRGTDLNNLPKYNNGMIMDRLYLPKVSSSQAGLADPDMYYDINTRIPNLFNAVDAKIDANKEYIDEKFNLLPYQFITDVSSQPTQDIVQLDFQIDKKTGNFSNKHVYIAYASEEKAGVMRASDKQALTKAIQDIASLQAQIGGLGYTHPAGTAANKPQGLYKFATDATSHISSVLAVVQKDITDLGIPSNTNLTDAINNAKNEVLTTVDQQIDSLVNQLSSLINRFDTLINRFDTLDTQLNDLLDRFSEHVNDKNNPHKVTKAQIGLSNVNNTSDMQKPVSTLQTAAISNARAEAITTAETLLNNHANRRDNPHVVTRAQLGLDTTNEVVFKKVTAVNGFHKE